MNSDRYEIRSKIGEGGVGAVYRAFDSHLNREVAIKRVLSDIIDQGEDEATELMLKEANSLCSLQHPNIVTIFDSGIDKDGPYVVMELLSGKTIDEMVERGVLTYNDFRELAIQSQEALIAAQERDLVHRDIKPSNIMITWLPSGRFHIKLVDFGLAKFSPKPSHQTIDHGDAVFGSIRFMAPEQFERRPLDKRTDMYAMGCVYYYCLAGQPPFDGEHAPQVMTAHLQHQVTSLAELRPDLPRWLCDWVMWHISRDMDHRPASANEALSRFVMCENNPEAAVGAPDLPAGVDATGQVVTPGATYAGSGTTAPVDLTSALPITSEQVTGLQATLPSPHTGLVHPQTASVSQRVPALQLQTGAVHAQTMGQTGQVTVPQGATAPVATGVPGQPGTVAPLPKAGISNTVKAVIGGVLAVALIVVGLVWKGASDKSARNERLTELVSKVGSGDPVPMNKDDVELLLTEIIKPEAKEQGERNAYFQALSTGTATDGSDISSLVAAFAKDANLQDELRIKLFQVAGVRKEEGALPILIEAAKGAETPEVGTTALKAASSMATTSNFEDLLAIVTTASNSSVKNTAVDLLTKVISKSENPGKYAAPVLRTYRATPEGDGKVALLRLMGASGGSEAAEIVSQSLGSDDRTMQLAAVSALRSWPDDSQFEKLFDFAKDPSISDRLRSESFSALISFLQKEPRLDEDMLSLYWTDVASIATGKEQREVISAMAKETSDWADDVLDFFVENADDDKISFAAESAKQQLATRRRRAERSGR